MKKLQLPLKWALTLVAFIAFSSSLWAQEGPPPVPVETVQPSVEDVKLDLDSTGLLLAERSVTITSESPGRIVTIHVKDGQEVKKGDVLISLDDSLLKAELAQAKAKVDHAQLQYQRLESLVTSGAGKTSERDEALKQLKIEEAILGYTQTKLDQTQLNAPFDGTLGLMSVEPGDYVTPGQALVTLEAMDTLRVDFKVPETYLNQIQGKHNFELSFDGLPGQLFEGQVLAIQPHANETHSFIVRGTFNNSERKLRPGLFVRVKLMLSHHSKALMVPEHAISLSVDGPYLFKVVEGKVQKVLVKTGVRKNAWVEITEGISPEDSIVISGQNRLFDGASVYPAGP